MQEELECGMELEIPFPRKLMERPLTPGPYGACLTRSTRSLPTLLIRPMSRRCTHNYRKQPRSVLLRCIYLNQKHCTMCS